MGKAARKKIGTGDVLAQFCFVCRSPELLASEAHQHKLLRQVFAVERGRIQERTATSFVAFMESAHDKTTKQYGTQMHPIPGRIDLISVRDVQKVLETKMLHASESYRKKGNVSTHPPQFLTKTTLVVVAGSRRFLMDNVDLYLEQEGVLRRHTFELLKDVADLQPVRSLRGDNYLSLDVAHEKWYRGNVEALGQLTAHPPGSEADIFTTSQMFGRIGG